MTIPTKDQLDVIDMMSEYNQFRPVPEREYLLAPAGVEHYRLLKWMGMHYKGLFNEIGVYMGLGSACLASDIRNAVAGWDIDYQFLNWNTVPINITLKKSQGPEWFSPEIAYADIILVDAWHNGQVEADIYCFLLRVNYKGILIYDDIYYNDAMRSFWNGINHPGKIDATHIGHSTGTGIIDFSL